MDQFVERLEQSGLLVDGRLLPSAEGALAIGGFDPARTSATDV
jgi:hypothetical protein